MNLDGARIYDDGVEIRQIVNSVKAISPSSEVSMRFLKCGNSYEALLWGKANDIPIGVYKRGPSISKVLDTLSKKVSRQCLRIRKFSSPLAMAG